MFYGEAAAAATDSVISAVHAGSDGPTTADPPRYEVWWQIMRRRFHRRP